MKYDPNIYRQRGNGETIQAGDHLLLSEDIGPTAAMASVGLLVTDADDYLVLEPLPKAPEPAIPAHSRRKGFPLVTGVLKYFPDALLAVAECSRKGNDQHNPGKPLHWDRSKSGDEADALGRHLLASGTLDTDGVRHSTKVAWRALAMLQKEIEALPNPDVPKQGPTY